MEWAEIAAQAQSNAWVTAFSTTGADRRPHVVFVAPSLGKEGHAMVATWRHTRKARNAAATGQVAMHWPGSVVMRTATNDARGTPTWG
jgi:hypothetical protein